jgi:hypothetical protein
MKRALLEKIKNDLGKKIILLSGPRQSGKTTLSLSISSDVEYLNYDIPEHRVAIIKQSWRKDSQLLIFDELHKMPKWKLFLKGLYDQNKTAPILVTGSARLDIAKRAGDSLAGRHFSFRMHPFTLKELHQATPKLASLDRLLQLGGFPEPYLSKEENFAGRWRKSHLDLILRQDVIDLEQIREINQLATLVQLLRGRVGSTVSLNSLAEDLQVDFSTVKRWLSILENLYVVFKLTPWSKNISRSLTKAAKYYFYDNGQVLGDEGAQFENLVACAILREVHFAQDVEGREISLYYLRNKEKDEIDFCVVEKTKVSHLIEAKLADEKPTMSFKAFSLLKHDNLKSIQIVKNNIATRDYPFDVRVCSAEDWLKNFSL